MSEEMEREKDNFWTEVEIESLIGCVDEIERMISLMTGLRHMSIDVLDDSEEIGSSRRLKWAYTDMLYRETTYIIQRLEAVAEVLYGDVKRRGRIRRAVRAKRERRAP